MLPGQLTHQKPSELNMHCFLQKRAQQGLTVGILLIRYSVVYTGESISLFYFHFISRFVFNRR